MKRPAWMTLDWQGPDFYSCCPLCGSLVFPYWRPHDDGCPVTS